MRRNQNSLLLNEYLFTNVSLFALLASLGVSEIGDSHQMIIEIIKKNIWEVKVTTDDGHQMRKQLETYEEVTSFVEGLLAGYHPNQKKIEDYGSE